MSRCSYCHERGHTIARCQQMEDDLRASEDYRTQMGKVIWTPWMLDHWWIVGEPDTDLVPVDIAA